jgi:uncharacterized glyoxalase superfamily protein PhnB
LTRVNLSAHKLAARDSQVLEETMRDSPPGWPRISSALFYDEAAKAIEWLCRAFGFEVRLKIEGEDGGILHSELLLGEGVVMVADSKKTAYRRSPRAVGGANTQNLMAYVDDVEAHCARARAAGARITIEPKTTDYGEEYWEDRGYEAEDLEGHHWYFSQRLRSPKQ